MFFLPMGESLGVDPVTGVPTLKQCLWGYQTIKSEQIVKDTCEAFWMLTCPKFVQYFLLYFTAV